MRLLIVQETDWLKRNPAQQHHLAEMMSLRGHRVRVIDHGFLWRTEDRSGLYSRRKVFNNIAKIHRDASVTVVRPGFIALPGLDYASLLFSHRKEIERQIREFSPDVIIGFGILNSYLATRIAKGNHIPFIYYWIDVLHLLIPFKPFHPLGRLVESLALKRADRVLVINDRLKDYVVRAGASRERTGVLRAGIDIGRFDPNINGSPIRKQYGFGERDFVLFFMGWLYHFSGLKEVVAQLAESSNRNLKLLIVGEGDAYNELEKLREKHNLGDRLILTGRKDYTEIPGLIAAADVCLLPADPDEPIMWDIVPIKTYEYMAMKKPIIATRLPGVIREFGEGNGVVYVDRPEDVITRAEELSRNGRVTELGSIARRFVEKNSWDKITDEFEAILADVIKEKQSAAVSE